MLLGTIAQIIERATGRSVDPEVNLMDLIEDPQEIASITIAMEDALGIGQPLDNFNYEETPLSLVNIVDHIRRHCATSLARVIPLELDVRCPRLAG